MPQNFIAQLDGKASIAATSTMVASTPLQPASIDTPKPVLALCSTRSYEITEGR
jgi:hypothetical protein